MERSKNHIAGIIPIAGSSLNFGFDWHDCMMPIGNNYLALERSALECAYAGCSSIWVVSTDNILPLVRNRMKDFILDPVYQDHRFSSRKYYLNNIKNYRNIPIFYISIPPRSFDKFDSLPYSIVYGAKFSLTITDKVSQWIKPDSFYVSFPMGTYEPVLARPVRKQLINNIPVILQHDNKTVRDNEYLGFTFFPQDIPQFTDIIKAGVRKTFRNENGDLTLLPKEERFEAARYDLNKVFGNYNPPNTYIRNVRWYYNISNWKNYRLFLGSVENSYLNKRRPNFIKARHISDFKFSEEEENGNV